MLKGRVRADTEEMVCYLQVYGQHVAVHNLSLHLRMGEVTALLGHNGAGAHLLDSPPFFRHHGMPMFLLCTGAILAVSG